MRYTRYEKNNNQKGTRKFMFLLVLMLAIALVLGSIIFKFLLNGTDSSKTKNSTESIEGGSDNRTKLGSEYQCYTIQCGSYSNQENAQALVNKLKEKHIAFILKEGSESKVMISLYDNDEKVSNVVKELDGEGIKSFKVTFSLPQGNTNKAGIIEIVKGYITILDKLTEKDIKAVKTGDFKKYTEEIPVSDGEGKEKLEELKKHISKLPEEVSSKELQTSYEFLSNLLIEYKI